MSSSLLTKDFWEATAERAIKTLVQTALASGVVGATGIMDIDWAQVGSVSGLAFLISILTSIGSATLGNNGPSLATETLKDAA